MSGGSWDYLYEKVEEAAARMEAECVRLEYPKPHRAEFAARLRLVAKALHAIEWVDSFDWGAGDDVGPITEALGRAPPFCRFCHEAHLGEDCPSQVGP